MTGNRPGFHYLKDCDPRGKDYACCRMHLDDRGMAWEQYDDVPTFDSPRLLSILISPPYRVEIKNIDLEDLRP